MWTREECAWMAGLVEGEGSIIVPYTKEGGRKTAPGAHVRVAMTDEDVIHRLASVARVGYVWKKEDHHLSSWSKKPQWVWELASVYDSYAFLVAIYPWMGARRRAKIEEAVERFKERGPGRPSRGKREVATECRYGHSRSEFGFKGANNRWQCRECNRIKAKRHYHKQKAAVDGRCPQGTLPDQQAHPAAQS